MSQRNYKVGDVLVFPGKMLGGTLCTGFFSQSGHYKAGVKYKIIEVEQLNQMEIYYFDNGDYITLTEVNFLNMITEEVYNSPLYKTLSEE